MLSQHWDTFTDNELEMPEQELLEIALENLAEAFQLICDGQNKLDCLEQFSDEIAKEILLDYENSQQEYRFYSSVLLYLNYKSENTEVITFFPEKEAS